MTIEATPPPTWLTAIFHEIDAKTFGLASDVLAEDVSFGFGVGSWTGRHMVREKLRSFDLEMDTVHHVNEFWDGGQVKFMCGKVEMHFHDVTQRSRQSTARPCGATSTIQPRSLLRAS